MSNHKCKCTSRNKCREYRECTDFLFHFKILWRILIIISKGINYFEEEEAFHILSLSCCSCRVTWGLESIPAYTGQGAEYIFAACHGNTGLRHIHTHIHTYRQFRIYQLTCMWVSRLRSRHREIMQSPHCSTVLPSLINVMLCMSFYDILQKCIKPMTVKIKIKASFIIYRCN